MNAKATGTFAERADGAGFLAWEDLSAHAPSAAFRQTLKELLLRPGLFFEKMSTTGGLREPLAFFWVILTIMILLSFPLALSYFALAAPAPMEVSTEVYNRHLLLPRAAGFLTVLLPVVLAVAGAMIVLGGTVFHLGARFFGARNWEGSVSIWCYAKSAGMAPVALAEAAACVVCIGCYLLTLAWPGARPAAASVARWSLFGLGGGAAVGVLLSLTALFHGCIRAFKLSAERGAAAVLAGVLLVGALAAGVGYAFLKRGLRGGLIASGAAAVALAILLVMHILSGGLSDKAQDAQQPA